MRKLYVAILAVLVICGIAWGESKTTLQTDYLTVAGTLDATGAVTGESFTADPTATPGIVFRDSGGTASDDNAIIYGNLSDTGDGTEDMDLYFRSQISGTMTTFMQWDASATSLAITGKVVNSTSTFTTAGPTDNVDVSGINVLFIDASGATVTIGGFTGGVNSQILRVVRLGTTNDAILEHNEGGGSQDIFLADEADQTLSTYGGWTLVCNGTSWFEVGY